MVSFVVPNIHLSQLTLRIHHSQTLTPPHTVVEYTSFSPKLPPSHSLLSPSPTALLMNVVVESISLLLHLLLSHSTLSSSHSVMQRVVTCSSSTPPSPAITLPTINTRVFLTKTPSLRMTCLWWKISMEQLSPTTSRRRRTNQSKQRMNTLVVCTMSLSPVLPPATAPLHPILAI